MDFKVLDCTLRDGGYVNDWSFGQANIKRVTERLTEANIDIIECGFLSQKKKYDPDKSIFDTISRLSKVIPSKRGSCKYVCMINYGEYNSKDIPDFDGSSVDGIRVVFHKQDAKEALNFCRELSSKGYMLFIQPMVTINFSDFELLELLQDVNKINPYAFYIVDSFGVMKKNDLLRIFHLIDNNLSKNIKIGYHSHNNLQLAYSNAQALLDVCTKRTRIIDATVFGIGRGAGNLNTELFVQYVNELYECKYNIYPLLQIIDETLNQLYSTNYWGYSLPHYLSAISNCHPNYASYLSDKNTLTVESISEILSGLPQDRKANYDKNYIEDIYIKYQKKSINDRGIIGTLSQLLGNKAILLIAPGSSIESHAQEISFVAKQKEIVVISVNFIPDKFDCHYTFISNAKRFNSIMKSDQMISKKSRMILTSNISVSYPESLIVNYSDLLNDTPAVKDNAMLMLLKLLISLNVKKVYLAGFDGYSYDSTMNYANKDMFFTTSNQIITELNSGIARVLSEFIEKIEMHFVTPTKYQDLIDIKGAVKFG